MSLSERNRAVLYRRLSHLIDDEEAVGEMLSYFPARDVEEPVTKEFVATVEANLRVEMQAIRGEIHAEVNRMIMWSVGVNSALLALVLALTGLR